MFDNYLPLLTTCLTHLGQDPNTLLDYTLIHQNHPGAFVFHLHLRTITPTSPTSPSSAASLRLTSPIGFRAYLKLTPYTPETTATPIDPPYSQPAYTLADREARFYLHLAPLIPVRIPHAYAIHLPSEPGVGSSIGILLESIPTTSPGPWDPTRYISAARALAKLHAYYWARIDTLVPPHVREHLSPSLVATLPQDIVRARLEWSARLAEGQYPRVFNAAVHARISNLLDRASDILAIASILPQTLLHGAPGSPNILHPPSSSPASSSNDAAVLLDWHLVGPGIGPGELAFLLQQDEILITGSPVPWEEAFASYHGALVAGLVERGVRLVPTMEQVRRAADACLLYADLTRWAYYLQGAEEGQFVNVVRRVEALAKRLGFVAEGDEW